MTRRVFDPEQDNEVAQLYRSGIGTRIIAEMYGCEKSAVSNSLKRQGINRRTNRDLTDAEEVMIARIHEVTKASPYRIAQAYGKGAGLIRAAIKRQGRIGKDGRYALTQGEEEQIAKIYKHTDCSVSKIARVYGIGNSAVSNAIKRQGVAVATKVRGRDIGELVREYKDGNTVDDIAENHGLKHSTVARLLSGTGVFNGTNRKYFFNESVFDDLDSEGALYWLGFAYADGNVTHSELRFGLSSVDLSHMERLREFMDSQATIRANERTCSVGFASVKMSQRLMDLGVIVGRGHFDRLAPHIPSHLANHFIRGYLDGDGCIARPHKVIILGQQDILYWIRETLHVEARASDRVEPRKRKGIYEISWGGRNQAPRIAEYIYKDATIWLERKRAITDNWE